MTNEEIRLPNQAGLERDRIENDKNEQKSQAIFKIFGADPDENLSISHEDLYKVACLGYVKRIKDGKLCPESNKNLDRSMNWGEGENLFEIYLT